MHIALPMHHILSYTTSVPKYKMFLMAKLAYKNVLYFDTELVSSYTLNMCLDTTSLMFCILVLYLEVLSFNMFC